MCGWIGISLNILHVILHVVFVLRKCRKKLESNEEISGSESNKKKVSGSYRYRTKKIQILNRNRTKVLQDLNRG